MGTVLAAIRTMISGQRLFFCVESKQAFVFVKPDDAVVELIDNEDLVASFVGANECIYLIAILALCAFDVTIIGGHPIGPRLAITIGAATDFTLRSLDADLESLEIDMLLDPHRRM